MVFGSIPTSAAAAVAGTVKLGAHESGTSATQPAAIAVVASRLQ
jgi:hypothetical protein